MKKSEQTRLRFSDAVRGSGSTAKSLRRWIETLGIKPDDGGWLSFLPLHVVMFAIMRHLVDWGVSVRDASDMANSIVMQLMTGEDDVGALDDAAFLERIGKSNLPGLPLMDLVISLRNTTAFVVRVDGKEPSLMRLARKKGPIPLDLSIHGSLLALNIGHIAFGVVSALDSGVADGA